VPEDVTMWKTVAQTAVAIIEGFLMAVAVCTTSEAAQPAGQMMKPSPMRTWTDSSGQFKVEAALVWWGGAEVRLRKRDGKEITVAVDRLSEGDQYFVGTGKEMPKGAATETQALSDVPLPAGVQDVSRERSGQRVPYNLTGMESNPNPRYVPGIGDVDYSPPPLPKAVAKGAWAPTVPRDMTDELAAFYRERLKPPEWQESKGTIKYLGQSGTREIPWVRFEKRGEERAVRVLIRGNVIEVVEYFPASAQSPSASTTAPKAKSRAAGGTP